MATDINQHMRTHLYKYAHLHNDSEWVFFDVGLQVNSRATQTRNITPCVVTSQKSKVNARQLKSPRTAPAPPDALAVGNPTS